MIGVVEAALEKPRPLRNSEIAHMSRGANLPQRQRLLAAAIYLILLCAVSWSLFGDPVPSLGAAGTWFYAGLITLVLSVALAEPHFTSPADCLLNGVALLLVAVAFPTSIPLESAASGDTIVAGKLVAGLFAVGLITLATTVIATKDHGGRLGQFSLAGMRACQQFGSAVFVYSTLYLFSSYAAYGQDGHALATLFGAWLVIVVLQPAERYFQWRSSARPRSEVLGRVVALAHPGVASATLGVRGVQPQELVQVEGIEERGTVLDVSPLGDGHRALIVFPNGRNPKLGATVTSIADRDGAAATILASVEPGTHLNDLRLRLPARVRRVREGHLLSVGIRGQHVAYQIYSARVDMETIEPGVTHRYLSVAARKVGHWDEASLSFRTVPWLPDPGAAITLDITDDSTFDGRWIGAVPDSKYGVAIDAHPLVTHNTAILGILGSGKTYLAFELIGRVTHHGCRAIVVDITGQYSPHLLSQEERDTDAAIDASLATGIAPLRNNVTQGKADGGNRHAFRAALREQVDAFLTGDRAVWVVNPAAFDVTRQDTNAYQGQAAIVSLTIVEVTRILAEELLEALSGELSTTARVMLVLEEAHSLVPEWNSTSNEADKQASAGIARAVLQGRKFGLGILAITQRTANVSKTVLNQCNTVFALRSFDATGMEFLSNYMGSDYSHLLPTLDERTAVVFGRASSCDSPLIVKLNDREAFLAWLSEQADEDTTAPREDPDATPGTQGGHGAGQR
ncbi:MAG: DUF87 domain-containing protein [Actinomycetota bacterium]